SSSRPVSRSSQARRRYHRVLRAGSCISASSHALSNEPARNASRGDSCARCRTYRACASMNSATPVRARVSTAPRSAACCGRRGGGGIVCTVGGLALPILLIAGQGIELLPASGLAQVFSVVAQRVLPAMLRPALTPGHQTLPHVRHHAGKSVEAGIIIVVH